MLVMCVCVCLVFVNRFPEPKVSNVFKVYNVFTELCVCVFYPSPSTGRNGKVNKQIKVNRSLLLQYSAL